MKKILALGLLIFALPLFVYAADKSTTVSYNVQPEASYEWSVPAAVTVSDDVTTNNLQHKPGRSAIINVTASNVTLPEGYQLVVYYPSQIRRLVNGNSSIRYYIDEGIGDPIVTGELANILMDNCLALTVNESTNTTRVSSLYITIYEDDIAEATNIGEHTDTITFTATVIEGD